jgi:hypothetical protein
VAYTLSEEYAMESSEESSDRDESEHDEGGMTDDGIMRVVVPTAPPATLKRTTNPGPRAGASSSPLRNSQVRPPMRSPSTVKSQQSSPAQHAQLSTTAVRLIDDKSKNDLGLDDRKNYIETDNQSLISEDEAARRQIDIDWDNLGFAAASQKAVRKALVKRKATEESHNPLPSAKKQRTPTKQTSPAQARLVSLSGMSPSATRPPEMSLARVSEDESEPSARPLVRIRSSPAVGVPVTQPLPPPPGSRVRLQKARITSAGNGNPVERYLVFVGKNHVWTPSLYLTDIQSDEIPLWKASFLEDVDIAICTNNTFLHNRQVFQYTLMA